MRKRNRFTRFEPLFNCSLCGRKTRNPDHSGTELCGECYELAGFDNQVNDNAETMTPELIVQRDAWYNAAVAKGGDGDSIKGACGYLWPEPKKSVDAFQVPADLSIPEFLRV